MQRTLKICIVDGFSENDVQGLIGALTMLGCEVVRKPTNDTNFFINASVTKLSRAKQLARDFPNIPVINYCWDYYLWAHDGRYPYYEWQAYAEFLKESKEVWVPSFAQGLRLKELLGINSFVIKTGIVTYDHEVRDDRFVLDPMRYYENDENNKWVEQACAELNIPIVHSEHQYSEPEFRKLVATCSFMVSPYREASTGGLTLMEGLWHGKASLVSNSPYQGAFDYVGKFGFYFQFDNYEVLKKKIQWLWENPQTINIAEARAYMIQGFSYDAMAKSIVQRLQAL